MSIIFGHAIDNTMRVYVIYTIKCIHSMISYENTKHYTLQNKYYGCVIWSSLFQRSQSEWQTVFFICAGVYMFSNIFYVIFASGEEQEWSKEPVIESTNNEIPLKKDMEMTSDIKQWLASTACLIILLL